MPLLQLAKVAQAGRLQPVTANIEQGEILHLVGPNGAGKSTLLTRLAGLSSGEGRVLFEGQPLDTFAAQALARRRAWLTQQETPPFSMPVWHYLTLHQQGGPQDSLMQDICGALALADKLGRPAHQLSGGEWQRVRLAAVILQIHPRANSQGQLLLLDEPMNSLDVAQQNALDSLLSELRNAGITIVMSSHDLNHSLRFATHCWLMRGGSLLAAGATPEVLTADNLAAAYGTPFRLLETDGYQFMVALDPQAQNLPAQYSAAVGT
ncbi:vitamin B12 ABC transporter ATP-binding protein BtuD [uncultured Pluralibacter sp.]|uniref:vitamin B12 ABC transporter ATP-binding protein BtuD n=1 Tax=uncultured Pluralibacter sp. TaxID=1490864 RepID=UPI00260B3C35|nr:vitamin B12 ABC transporter ATP-binding protein BtuD [uncultured Pluralibacter sp.]